MGHGRAIAAVLVVGASLTAAAPAAAQVLPEVVGPYDGSIPFNCQLQDVGTGTEFPDPDADPFCVEFDETSQNVTDLGIVDFLLNEPARVAAAVEKCFYFQRDHWTGSIAQGQPPELWHWDGNYYFDRAKGTGGVSVRNLRVLGIPFDLTVFVPPAYQPFFDPNGGGGVLVELETNPDPVCGAQVDTPEEREQVYGAAGGVPDFGDCVPPGGELRGRRVGSVRLGMSRDAARRALGPPLESTRAGDVWCLVGAAQLGITFNRGSKAILIRTSSRGHAVRGVATGDSARRAKRRFDLSRLVNLPDARIMVAEGSGRKRVLFGLGGRRVQWLALTKPQTLASDRRLRRALTATL